jgi:SAM-dependent methyltransferase
MTLEYVYRSLGECLLCGSRSLDQRVQLEPIPIATPNFKMPSDPELARQAKAGVPLELYQCSRCGHVQVGEIGNPELQYRDYVYRTVLSLGLPEHFERYAASVVERLSLPPGTFVVEIGSNDGTLLRAFQNRGMQVLGVDPARAIAQRATASGVETLCEFFTENLGKSIAAHYGQAGLIIANNVIANVPDLVDFARGLAALLAPNGTFVFETQYGPDVFERMLLDTVYHEHISYFCLKATADYFLSHGMEVIDVERIQTKGGSIRVTVQRRGGPRSRSAHVSEMISDEVSKGAYTQAYFDTFAASVARIRSELEDIAGEVRAAGESLGGYGVSVGTTTLLPQLGLTKAIDFLVDDDPTKASKLMGPGYEIPVIKQDELYSRNAKTIVVFAWRYADAIVSRHGRFIANGGRFLVPLPQIHFLPEA